MTMNSRTMSLGRETPSTPFARPVRLQYGQCTRPLLLVLTRAALVTVAPTPGDACPSSARVQAALEKHARQLVPRADEEPAKQLVLSGLVPRGARGGLWRARAGEPAASTAASAPTSRN